MHRRDWLPTVRPTSQLLASSVRRQSPRAVPAGLVVGAGQAADDDAGLLVLSVDELAVADVDADVRQAPGVRVLQHGQVAGPQITVGYGAAGDRLAPGAGADVH